MKRILASLGVTSLAMLGATATAVATDESSGGGEKITICHATGSETNPYVSVTTDLNGLNGHVGHQHDEDIIPRNNGKVLPGGQNLDKVDWWNAGCARPGGGTSSDDHDKKITICHATGSESNPFVVITIALQGLNGHGGDHHQHSEDIIPPNDGKVIPEGQNWTAKGQATFDNGCVPAAVVPQADTPTDMPTVPPAETPVVPPAMTPVVPGARAGGAVSGGGTGAVVAPNQGFNVQTAVAGTPEQTPAPWVGGVAALLLAGAAVAARRTLAGSGIHSGRQRQ